MRTEHPLAPAVPLDRLAQIELARRAVMYGEPAAGAPRVESWIERSWQRCLTQGHVPEAQVVFDVVTAQHQRQTGEANHHLTQAARPVIERLGRAIANTRYFAILTNAQGVVVDVHGVLDHADPRARLIGRVGVDLSEQRVGTTAIGTVLAELQPVWIHRGEHFFQDNTVFSCAGAPVFGPDGECVGMLDLTGIEAPERPELKHLAAQSARSIENALTLARPHQLVLRLNWPGRMLGDDSDGLICLDGDGYVTGANQGARQMIFSPLARMAGQRLHASDLFAMPWEMLFDAARRASAPLDVPLWSGLRLTALARLHGQPGHPTPRTDRGRDSQVPLKDVEIALIRKAVDDARGNVMEAARALGISRATVYRKLGRGKGPAGHAD